MAKKRTRKKQFALYKKSKKKKIKSSFSKNQRILVGFQSVKEALTLNPQNVLQLWIKKGIQKERFLIDFLKKKEKSKSLVYKSSAFFNKISSHHQHIAALVKGRPLLNWNEVGKQKNQIFLALDGIQDPRNLGAILRLSWLMGVSAIFLPKKQTASLMNPSVSKVSCGATEHIPIEEAPLKESLKKLKEKNFKVFALNPNEGKTLWNLKLPSQFVWALGSEEKGIQPHLENLSDIKVKIPLKAPKASLNVTTAAAIALAETQRQFSNSFHSK